jgi:hypothetical protein
MQAILTVTCIAALMAGAAYADCPYPAAPAKLPDGASATLEEMLAGKKDVDAYQKAINEYTTCIDNELDEKIKSAGDKLKPEQKADMQKIEAQKHNAAVDQLQSVAERFNEQVKAYKARAAEKKG